LVAHRESHSRTILRGSLCFSSTGVVADARANSCDFLGGEVPGHAGWSGGVSLGRYLDLNRWAEVVKPRSYPDELRLSGKRAGFCVAHASSNFASSIAGSVLSTAHRRRDEASRACWSSQFLHEKTLDRIRHRRPRFSGALSPIRFACNDDGFRLTVLHHVCERLLSHTKRTQRYFPRHPFPQTVHLGVHRDRPLSGGPGAEFG